MHVIVGYLLQYARKKKSDEEHQSLKVIWEYWWANESVLWIWMDHKKVWIWNVEQWYSVAKRNTNNQELGAMLTASALLHAVRMKYFLLVIASK